MLRLVLSGILGGCLLCGDTVHVWEMREIALRTTQRYENPYTDVTCWAELKGPGFSTRVYGFWDGGDVFRIRLVGTAAGRWTWTSGSNQPDDKGLNGKTGAFTYGIGQKKKSSRIQTGAGFCARQRTDMRSSMPMARRSFLSETHGWQPPHGAYPLRTRR
jgi:hypothetical protein